MAMYSISGVMMPLAGVVHLRDVHPGLGAARLAVQAGEAQFVELSGSAARSRPNSELRPGSSSVSPRSSIQRWRSAGRPERMSMRGGGSV
jgi:hypothetical protein